VAHKRKQPGRRSEGTAPPSPAPPPPVVRRRRPRAAVALVALALLAVGGLFAWRSLRLRGAGGLGPLPAGLSPGRLNLVLVTLDTTRADRLGCYGSREVETPNLDRLAAQGVRFENAISPTPLTLPAHCSLMTGLFPGRTGCATTAASSSLPSG